MDTENAVTGTARQSGRRLVAAAVIRRGERTAWLAVEKDGYVREETVVGDTRTGATYRVGGPVVTGGTSAP